MLAKMTVIGLYQYDNDLFQTMLLPTGIDRDIVVDSILNECSSFNLVHPDYSLFTRFLYTWSKRRLPIWTKLYETTLFEYDPIANYDRTEEHTESIEHEGTDTVDSTRSGTQSDTGTVGTVSSGSGTTTEAKTAFNSQTFENTSQVTGTDTTNQTVTNNLAGTSNVSGTDERETSYTDTINRRLRAYGNIGVTTTQQMIEQERTIDLFDVYAIIVSDFIETFCVQVY